MFESLSYKNKFILLGAVFVMLSITAYKRSFSALCQIVSEYKILSKETNETNKKSTNTTILMKEIAYIDKIIGKEGVARDMVRQEIISFVSNEGPQVSISDIQPIHIFDDENYITITNQLDLTGDSNQLLELAYNFEKKFNFSRIVSMNFYTVKTNSTSDILHLKIIFQNYESK